MLESNGESNEEKADDNDNDKIDLDVVVKKVHNHSIDELIKAESLLETSDDAEINWEVNAYDIIEALEEKEKAESEKEREDVTDDYSTDILILNVPWIQVIVPTQSSF